MRACSFAQFAFFPLFWHKRNTCRQMASFRIRKQRRRYRGRADSCLWRKPIECERPFKALLKNDIWIVDGIFRSKNLPEMTVGGQVYYASSATFGLGNSSVGP